MKTNKQIGIIKDMYKFDKLTAQIVLEARSGKVTDLLCEMDKLIEWKGRNPSL